MHMYAEPEGQKMGSGLLELESQAVVGQLVEVLATQLSPRKGSTGS